MAFLHPSWGASNLVTVNDAPGEYAARVVDEEGEVVWTAEFGRANGCNPSCADGAITSTVYAWDGEDYR